MSNVGTYILQRPMLPSWTRYRRVFGAHTDLSVLRALEYELLDQIRLSGRVLDFGGGSNANYRSLMQKWRAACIYETANIDPNINPTYLITPGQPLPIKSGTYDSVVTLNTLEHIYEVENVLCDLIRVLKPGGRLVATVPFLFRIHGHPDDFLRGTPSWWARTLMRIGFAEIVIVPLLWGPISTGLSVSGIPGPLKTLRRRSALLLDMIYAYRSRSADGVYYGGPVGESLGNSPLGFLITAMNSSKTSAE